MSDLLTIKKMNIRPFILFCVDLANSKDDEEARNLVDQALQKNVFSFYQNGEAKKELVKLFFVQQMERFKPAVKRLAEKRQEKKTFAMIMSPGLAQVLITPKDTSDNIVRQMSSFSDGFVVFNPKEGKDLSEEEELFPTDYLFEKFLSSLLEIASVKKTPFLELPLGICKECSAIFFGRQSNQEFCSQEHGQLWRSREAYRSKLTKPDDKKNK